jgi:hypothetical protein
MIEVIRGIKADPKSYDQGRYAKATECGTTYCVAGHAIVKSGFQFLVYGDGEVDDEYVVAPDTENSPLYSESWYSAFNQCNVIPPETAGRIVLGIHEYDAQELFYAHLTFGEILLMLEDWAFGDGVEWPADLKLTPRQRTRVEVALVTPRSQEDVAELLEVEAELLGRTK